MKRLLCAVLCFAVMLSATACHASETEASSGNASDFIPNPRVSQTIYFWDEGNMPAVTDASNHSYDADPPDFRPHMVFVPAADGVPVKGAVLINPGGAFSYRSPEEGMPVAEELSKLGYQCFVVNYRLRPYTQQEAALDLARGVRFVRKHAALYGIEPSDIAVMGFSAGGILSGELALHFQGTVNGTVLDADYTPDSLDMVSADVAAVGLIYSFYGRLSVASTDVEEFRRSNLPPTYVLYGSEEVFRGQIEHQVSLLQEAEVPVESHMLEGYRHGFGARGDWFGDYDRFLSEVFEDTSDETELLTIAEPRIQGNTLHFSISANGDASQANIITLLYENDALKDMCVNKLEGSFVLEDGLTYQMRVYVLDKDTMRPLMQARTFANLQAETAGSQEMQVMLNNTLSGADGTIHYTYYLPEDYDGSKRYPMLMTLPGYSNRFNTIQTTPLTENEYAQRNAEAWTGLAGDMIIVSPSLTDWGEKSARQTIELTDYFIEHFAVDTDRIYAAGFSAGGETLSRAIDMRPELFAAYLHAASQWDGGYEAAAQHRLPIYICMAQGDEYYGPQTAQSAYEGLKKAYQNAGISEEDTDRLLVLDLKDDAYFDGRLTGNYHGSGQLFANDGQIIRWMLGHSKASAETYGL